MSVHKVREIWPKGVGCVRALRAADGIRACADFAVPQ
jgi:hypothetical protein